MEPLLNFVMMVISLYLGIVIASVIMSWLVAFDVINRRNQFVYMVGDALYRLTEPALRPIRRMLPDLGGLDISPFILTLALIFVNNVIINGWLTKGFKALGIY
jgi:YggT family protein